MTRTLRLPIKGMSCGSCVHHVEDVLRSAAGVESVAVALRGGHADITLDPALATLDTLRNALRDAGYEPGEVAA